MPFPLEPLSLQDATSLRLFGCWVKQFGPRRSKNGRPWDCKIEPYVFGETLLAEPSSTHFRGGGSS